MGEPQRPTELATDRPGLTLRELTVPDVADYLLLVRGNGTHAHPGALTEEFGVLDPVAVRFGIRLHGVLIGRCDLLPTEPRTYGLTCWLDSGHTGRGLATLALHALLRYAADRLGATTARAEIDPDNHAAVALALRLGFERGPDTRYQRNLTS